MNGGKLALAPTGGSFVTPPARFRTALVSFLAGAIGLISGVIAYALYKLIALFANFFFYHRFAFDFTSARLNHLGLWAIVTPVIGGLTRRLPRLNDKDALRIANREARRRGDAPLCFLSQSAPIPVDRGCGRKLKMA